MAAVFISDDKPKWRRFFISESSLDGGAFPIGRKSAGQFFMSNLKRKYEQFSLTRGKR